MNHKILSAILILNSAFLISLPLQAKEAVNIKPQFYGDTKNSQQIYTQLCKEYKKYLTCKKCGVDHVVISGKWVYFHDIVSGVCEADGENFGIARYVKGKWQTEIVYSGSDGSGYPKVCDLTKHGIPKATAFKLLDTMYNKVLKQKQSVECK